MAVTRGARVGGGDINDAYTLELADGERLFVKTREDPPPREYATEAAALRMAGRAGGAARAGGGRLQRALPGARMGGGGPARRGRRGGARPGSRRRARRGRNRLRRSCAAEHRADPPLQRACGRLADLLRRAPAAAAAGPRRGHRRAVERRRAGRRSRLRAPARPGRPARAAGAPARRPLERQRPRRHARAPVAHRPGRLRRAPRGRPGDAAALRPPGPRVLPAYRRRTRSRPATRTASSSGSSSRCWCTPCCSAAGTARRSSAPRGATRAERPCPRRASPSSG